MAHRLRAPCMAPGWMPHSCSDIMSRECYEHVTSTGHPHRASCMILPFMQRLRPACGWLVDVSWMSRGETFSDKSKVLRAMAHSGISAHFGCVRNGAAPDSNANL